MDRKAVLLFYIDVEKQGSLAALDTITYYSIYKSVKYLSTITSFVI